jgi:CBS domain-containing protein
MHCPELPVEQAMDLMLEKHIHSLVVFGNGPMVGIVSDRDYAHKVVAKGINPETIRIGEIMTRNVITIGPSATIEERIRIMSKRRFRHFPVAEGGRIVGMVSMTDVMRVITAAADTNQEWQM